MPEPVLTMLLGAVLGVGAAGLPCPLNAGWILQQEVQLPSSNGGYSAITYEQLRRRIWLLSDLPEGSLTAWTSPSPVNVPRELGVLRLQVPPEISQQLDAEGLVLDRHQAWVATEGRRSRERPAQLLRVSLQNGALLQAVSLPAPWQAGANRGLASNAGPESLTRLSRPTEPLELLMAAERALLQDPADRVRLLRWYWPVGHPPTAAPEAQELGALRAPAGEGWGLTDVLVLHPVQDGPASLLSLWRRYREPMQWDNHLRLSSVPRPGELVDAIQDWDLQAYGLTAENWEGLSLGPEVSPGRPGLLLVSDDNRNPLQSSRLAWLEPRRTTPCSEPP